MRKHALILLFLLESVIAFSQQISGRVTDHHLRPIRSAEILLEPAGRKIPGDSLGNFLFSVQQPGQYVLIVTAAGYRTLRYPFKADLTSKHLSLTLHPFNEELSEIVISDNHVLNRRQNESLNVEVVDREFIQRNLGGSLMKSLERLPGVKTIGIGSGQSKPLIRGMGFNRVVVVDKGLKHEGQQWGADHGLEMDQFAAGEIELIKGAASFVYGSDAIGGVIDVKPARIPAPGSAGGAVDLVGKSNNMLYGTSVNAFARGQKWFMDSRFTYQSYGDYTVPADRVFVYDYAVDLDRNRLRNTAGMESGLHLNTGFSGQNFRSVLYLSNTFNKSGFFANAHGLEPRKVDEAAHDSRRRDLLMPRQEVNHFKIINKTSYHTNNHQLTLETGFQTNFRQEFSQYVNHGYMPPVYPAGMTIPENLERQFNKDVFSLNLRDEIALNRHTLTIGMSADHQDNVIDGWTFLVPSFRQAGAGIFAYDKFSLSDAVILQGALRYDHARLRTSSYSDWFLSETGGGRPPERLVRAEQLSRMFNSLVWSFGLNYNREHFSLKTNLGKSYRIPIAKELAANGVNYHYFSYERGNPALNAEVSYQADLGLGWNSGRWTTSFTPFYNYFPNYIYLNPTAAHDYFYGAGNQVFEYQQSRVMRYGTELQVRYQVSKSLSSELLGEYVFAKQLSGQKRGYTLPFSPPATALFNITWSPHARNGHQPYVSLDYRLAAAQNNIVPPEKKTAGYQVLNLQTGIKLDIASQPVNLNLQVQNLLNTRYLNHTSFYRLIELPEPGRNIILSLNIPFHRKDLLR